MSTVAQQRQAPRFANPPVLAEVEGENLPVADISLGGLRLSGHIPSHCAGDLITCTLHLPSLIGHRVFASPARIVAANGGWVACTFVRPDKGFLMCLKHCLDSLEDKTPAPWR